MKQIVVVFIIFFGATFISSTFAQSQSNWVLQTPSIILQFYSPAENKYAGIAIAYEKKLFRCRPTAAFIVTSGRSLGSFLRGRETSSNRNRLKLTINNKDYFGEGKTVMNTYTNGVEVGSFFDESVNEALKFPVNISVSIGNNPPQLSGRSVNTINIGLKEIIESCKNN